MSKFRIGLARMHKEPGEKRDFLPRFVARLEKIGGVVSLEYDYGSGMGLREKDYLQLAPGVQFVSHEKVYAQDYVLVLRYPGEEIVSRMRPGACLISMIHYPTRPQRVEHLRSLGLEAISLDSVKDDSGRRLVENLRSVGWNGTEVAYGVLRKTLVESVTTDQPKQPVKVTVLGGGSVGIHAIQAALHFDDGQWRSSLEQAGIPGVQVTVVDRDLTPNERVMRDLLASTDLLVDATQRPDPSQPVIPNAWIGELPSHAVLLDLSVDPYICDADELIVKGLEGIPQGNLDQYIFLPDDPAFEQLPDCVQTTNRRTSVSCYSWPGLHPKECMQLYGRQIQPLMRTLVEAGGVENIHPEGSYFRRAIARALLSRWSE